MIYLKQSTASQSVLIGPFIDDTDGKTAETGLTIANTDIRLSKNGGNMASKTSGGGTHDEAGWYTITLDATDTNTVGRLQLSVHVAGALPVWHEYQVLEEAIYDALCSASATGFDSAGGVNMTQISGDSTAADNLELFFDGTGYAAANSTIGTCTTNSDMRGTDNALLAASAPANFGDLSITPTTGYVNLNEDGSSYTAIPWNAAWDAEVQSEVNDGLVALGLDHLVSASVTGTDIVDNSIFAKLVSKSATADWDDFVNTTDSMQAIRDQGDSAWITATGFSTLSQADIRTAIGLASANLDTQLSTIDTVVDSNATAIAALNDIAASDILTTALTESYATDGSAFTLSQALYMIYSTVADFSISGTTLTTKRLDGSTTAMTFTLDDATNPTSRTRAT